MILFVNYLGKMRGYPQFSFWISITLVKIYIPCVIINRGKNTIELVGTVLRRIDKEQSLENSPNLQMELKPLLEKVVRSIEIILSLGDSFATMMSDPMFQEVLATTDSFSGIDLGAKFNYVLLTFSTGKVG